MRNDLLKELRTAAIGTVVLDVVLWLVSVIFFGFGFSVPAGLLMGSAGMLVNLLLLRRTVVNAVYHGKTRDMAGYLLRVLIASAVITAGLLFDAVNAPAAVLPFLYPKVLFGFMTLPSRKSSRNGGK